MPVVMGPRVRGDDAECGAFVLNELRRIQFSNSQDGFETVIASEAKQSMGRQERKLDCFASLAMTANPDTPKRPAARCARAVRESFARQRAWGMPGARCTRSLVCSVLVEHTSVVTTVAPDSPGIPARNGFNGLFRALPGERIRLVTVIRGLRFVGPGRAD
jgi:hypothetical protein